jgi:hypothetical protein
MYKTNEKSPVASAKGISYYVIDSGTSSDERRFGILGIANEVSEDKEKAEALFFTQAEAEACCRWLAKNEVYPCTFREILENIYHT